MKKQILMLVGFFFSLFTIGIFKFQSIHAFATYEYSYRLEEVESDITNLNVVAGDIKCTLSLSNNSSGYNLSGVRFKFDKTKFTVVYNNAQKPSKIIGDAAAGLTVAVEVNLNSQYDPENIGIFGFGTMGTDTNDCDGDVISFFLRKIPNAFSENDSISNYIYKPEIEDLGCQISGSPTQYPDYEVDDYFEYTKVVSYSYCLGDINGDGVVDLYDAQIGTHMLTAFHNAYPNTEFTTDANVTNLFPYVSSGGDYNGLYIMINGNRTLVLKVADVDYDNDIDSDDTSLLLSYYLRIMSGLTWDGDIGSTIHTETSIIVYPS
ncbi:MAG: hypothetical protein IKI45_02100 [Oscillospiraceae bacterium]|nr:hypothetical protein [Oscillospiraceae bacterium]